MHSPDVNQPVLLRGESGEFASRVEGITEGALILARPFGLPLDTDLDIGRPFEVQWTSAVGLYAQSVRVTERAIDGKVRIWHAEPISKVRVTNRRAHVRVSVALPLILEYGEEKFEASLLDVSEAALRCQMPQPLPTPEEGEEPSLRAHFNLGGAEFALDGDLFRSTPKRDITELVITLPPDERTRSALRRAVFAEQIRARQLSR
ncbi:PilZ domain-containing protein [Nocardioides sp. BP30]|uniref:PilZ domain-containing protein n=1 Tax=Nocardioides sp. BP30 TaxID=3036374 RepID=UPI002469982F|nr:PilZ domain-containing protein [Nocardioides sp. BP30]WGL53498.1 PilZ domain-containing protein [Nocardioides sp. BP30]